MVINEMLQEMYMLLKEWIANKNTVRKIRVCKSVFEQIQLFGDQKAQKESTDKQHNMKGIY